MLDLRIYELRNARKMSQVELAKVLGVSKQSISNWENDNILPSIEMLIKLSKFFSVSTDYLLGLEDKELLDVTGLSSDVIAHLRQIINDFRSSVV